MKRPLAYITAAWCGDPDIAIAAASIVGSTGVVDQSYEVASILGPKSGGY